MWHCRRLRRWTNLDAMYTSYFKISHTFAREAKRYVNSRQDKLLWNFVDERNKVHIKLLRFLGFKFLEDFLTDQTIYPL